MNELDFLVFTALFKEAFAKCFGLALKNPMTETESKIFCSKALDQTGLSIGWKSVKNYSIFICDGAAARQENPSVATLDTLARYVLGAPYTTEIQRKNDEAHYPYWFLYRERFARIEKKKSPGSPFLGKGFIWAGIAIVLLLIVYFKFIASPAAARFTDHFNNTDESLMLKNGWLIKDKDTAFWNKRNQVPRQLTLFTLAGDTWPSPSSKPGLKNLLLRPVPEGCFTAEVHLRNFIPKEEWQQAGILLLEDTTFTGKSIRFTLAFNDYFGGSKMPSEIYVQAITSLGNGFSKPEEIAHRTLFYPDSIRKNPALLQNFENSALRIEKHGDKYRFLYSLSATENGPFKEVVAQEFDMKPKYIGIFAMKGFTPATVIPVSFKFFRLTADPCN